MIDRINKRPYLFLCIVSLLTGILLYSQFIFGDKILAYAAWGSDTRQSYLPTYEFWHNRIAEGRFSIYDFSYGWGTNVFVALWGIADPFSAIPILLSLVFGINFIGRSLVYFQLLKSVLISLLGMLNKITVLINWICAFFNDSTSLRLLIHPCRYPLRKRWLDE